MRLYLWNENCAQAGKVAGVLRDALAAEAEKLEGYDVLLSEFLADYGIAYDDQSHREGTEEELVAEAKESLQTRYDHRPGGALDAFRRKCDRNVLLHFNIPKEAKKPGRPKK